MRRLVLTVLSVLVVILVAWSIKSLSYQRQPIAFPHKPHVALNIPCLTCHPGILEGVKASIPGVKVCILCHKEDTHNPKTQPIRDFENSGKEIPWLQICGVPDHVSFSHRMHVVLGRLECTSCHQDVKNATEPVTARTGKKETMSQCVDCHQQTATNHARQQAGTDCLTCHR